MVTLNLKSWKILEFEKVCKNKHGKTWNFEIYELTC